jgi:hypothetical protein
VKAFIAIILFIVLQSQHLLMVGTIVHYQWNKKEITAKFCINKNKPKVHCNGKCHLKKQLKNIEEVGQPSSNPNQSKEIKYFATEPFIVMEEMQFAFANNGCELLEAHYSTYNINYKYQYSYTKKQPPAVYC